MNDSPNRDVVIFTEALRRDCVERAGYVECACGGDNELRQRVEALLRANKCVGDFLEDSPQMFSAVARTKVFAGEKPGDCIGRYKLLQQIGEGGCGVVFVAQQEEPVRRLVALKIIKPGMDTKSVIARFEAERQALALMDHPNIAKVFDAGATDSGRPYFVMELIHGIKITEHCDRHSLATKDRLILFVQVCEAVQHAHQKGIIHRDIKPSNILVTTSEQGASVPVVIDFGIAKATTNQQLTDKTFFTSFEMLIGTPAYMSPEQAALASGVDLDTRTDVYSLGVLLYELLTGVTPFDAAELLKAGLDEVRRMIREREPARPSTRLSTMTAANLMIEAQHRQTSAPTLVRLIRGDLDWIAMKAMEKDRTRRYATAHGLALDVQRYLANETVSACPPSALYKFQKLVRRNRLLFAGMGLIAVLVVASLIVVSISLARERQAHRDADLARIEANGQRKKAEMSQQNALTEATRSRETMEFMKEMLHEIDPVSALGRDATLLREILDKTLKRLDLELTNQPSVQADLKLTIGGVYGAIGQDNKGEPLVLDALRFYRKSPAGAEQKLADTLATLSLMHIRLRKYADAEQEARNALAIETSRQSNPTMRVVKLETQLAWAIFRSDRFAEAENMFRMALVTGEHLLGKESEQLLDTRAGLATALSLLGNLAEAEALLRKSLKIGRQMLGEDHPYVANDMFRLALVLQREAEALDRQGSLDDANTTDRRIKLSEAESLGRHCLAIRRKLLSSDHLLLLEALRVLGLVLYQEENMTDAVDCYGELLAICRKRFGDKDPRVAENVAALAIVLAGGQNEVQFGRLAREFPKAWFARSEESAQQGRWSEAMAAASKYLEIEPQDHEAYHLLAPLLVQTGERTAYEGLCVRIIARFAGASDPKIADRMAKDCLILPRPGVDLKAAGDLAETAVSTGRGDSGALPYFQCCKALAEFRLGKYEEAEDWVRRVSQSSPHEPQAEAAAILALSQFKLNQLDKARTALANCNHIIKENLPSIEQGHLGGSWRDWIIAHALRDEAKTLIEGNNKGNKNSHENEHFRPPAP